jgi:hypothetical protein
MPPEKIPTFGWKAPQLSDLSFEDLNTLREQVTSDPANHNPAHASGKSIRIYTRSAERKLDALAWAVTYKLNVKRAAAVG